MLARRVYDPFCPLCPRCGVRRYTPYDADARVRAGVVTDKAPPFPAVSRMDNVTYICSWCGQDEALRDLTGAPPIPPDEWPTGEGE